MMIMMINQLFQDIYSSPGIPPNRKWDHQLKEDEEILKRTMISIVDDNGDDDDDKFDAYDVDLMMMMKKMAMMMMMVMMLIM